MKDNIAKIYQAIGFQKWLGMSEVAPPDSDTSIHAKSTNYISWLKDHPSALRVFQDIRNAAKGNQIVVFLDYDGTLSPIVNDPDRAFMSDVMRSAVKNVARHFPTAIITGRSRKKVYEFVKLEEVYYAGSHGMDIMGPSLQPKANDCKHQKQVHHNNENQVTLFQPAREFLPAIQKMLKELKEKTLDITGVFIEDNKFCISVHYRHVQQEDYDALEKTVLSVVEDYDQCFHLTRGKKVLEIRPSIKWNKGNALIYLLDTLGFGEPDLVLPIYIGDDRTDEDAFKALNSRGKGVSIIVSSVPRETSASFSLKGPSEVLAFLVRLTRWAEQC